MPPFIIQSVLYKNQKCYTIYHTSCRVISQRISSNQMFIYLWNYICENLVVKSVVLKLFSLLVFSSSSSVDVSSFGCVVILSLYLTLNFEISSLILAPLTLHVRLCKIYTTEHILLLGGLYFDISVIFECLNYWLYPKRVYLMSINTIWE